MTTRHWQALSQAGRVPNNLELERAVCLWIPSPRRSTQHRTSSSLRPTSAPLGISPAGRLLDYLKDLAFTRSATAIFVSGSST